MFPLMPAGSRISLRHATVIIAGVGVGVALFGFLLQRYLRRRRNEEERDVVSLDLPNGVPPFSREFSQSRLSGRLRRNRTPSEKDKGSSSQRSSFRLSTVPPTEADIISCVDGIHEIIHCLEKALTSLNLVRNRSEKDRSRTDLLSSVLDRLRILDTDINQIVADGGYEKFSDSAMITPEENWPTSLYPGANLPRAGTLSVLSDDSFMSAYEDLPLSLDDADVLMRDPLKLEKAALIFYQSGMAAAVSGEVENRKCRADFCQCDGELDFKAKVWCLRRAFAEVLLDEHNRVWLAQAGRQLIADLLRHARKDPTPFYTAYDAMILFLNDEQNLRVVSDELKQRRVAELGFWDVFLDFVLIDSFEDLARPPSVVMAVTRNMFISQSMKESTLSTVIWSMLKAKRSRLSVSNGFISHFYDISEVVSPPITLGFLGTDEHMRELCLYFQEQVSSFIVDIFNEHRVRYTSCAELSGDVWTILRARTEMVQSRLSTELLPVG